MKTKEEEILTIQTQQLFEEFEKLDFIKDNANEIKRRLMSKTAEENIKYFKKEGPRNPGDIFRGLDFQNAINQIIARINQEQGTQT